MDISIPRPVVDCGVVDVGTGEIFSVVVVCVVVIVVVVVSDAESSKIRITLFLINNYYFIYLHSVCS